MGALPVYAKFIEEITSMVKKLDISTYAFKNGGKLVTHMSMRYINSKSFDYGDFHIVQCQVQTETQEDFQKAVFKEDDLSNQVQHEE